MDRCFDIKTPLVQQLDQPFLTWVHTLQRVTRALIAGDTDEAEQWATEALKIGIDGGQPDAAVIFGAQFIMVSLWRGSLGDLIPMITQAIDDNPGLPVFVAVLALAHSEADHTEETGQLLQGFAKTGFDLPLDPTWLTGMIAYADAAAELRDPILRARCSNACLPSRNSGSTPTSPPRARSAARSATWPRSLVDTTRRCPISRIPQHKQPDRREVFAARSELSWGRMLLERRAAGDLETARQLLTRAHDAGMLHGYGTVARRATSALAGLN